MASKSISKGIIWDGGFLLESPNTIGDPDIQGYFSILKHSIHGVYHHGGKNHLRRYLSGFDFRYNSRKIADGERVMETLKRIRRQKAYLPNENL